MFVTEPLGCHGSGGVYRLEVVPMPSVSLPAPPLPRLPSVQPREKIQPRRDHIPASDHQDSARALGTVSFYEP